MTRRRLLDLLISVLERYVLAAAKLHPDDTPVPVLSSGKGRTKADPHLYPPYVLERIATHPINRLDELPRRVVAAAAALPSPA